MRRRTRNQPGMKREKERDEEEEERRRREKKGRGENKAAGRCLCRDEKANKRRRERVFHGAPWLFSARVEGNDKGVSQTEVCVSVCESVCSKKGGERRGKEE